VIGFEILLKVLVVDDFVEHGLTSFGCQNARHET